MRKTALNIQQIYTVVKDNITLGSYNNINGHLCSNDEVAKQPGHYMQV